MTANSAPANLQWRPALGAPDLLAGVVNQALATWSRADVAEAAEIDPELADTAEFCRHYGVALAESANCVVVSGKREGEVRWAACMVLATTRLDVNNIVRRQLDVRKASFAAMDDAVSVTGMAYGGITPIGLPEGWPILIAPQVAETGHVVIGSGLRSSKIRLPGAALLDLPNARVVPDLSRPLS